MDTERNLLFGVLALQADLIDAGQFAAVCTAWSQHPEQPLAELLLERGWLTAADRAQVESWLERKLARFRGNLHASLVSLIDDRVRRSLTALGESALADSLANWTLPPVDPDPWKTRPGAGGGGAALPDTPLPSALSDPTASGRYQLVHLHAQGGIGQIWLTRDQLFGRTVALKELRPEAAASPKMRARFLEEARITGQLEHPGIVPVYELAWRPGTPQLFYTMRFLKGRTLSEGVRAYHQKRSAGQAKPLDLLGLLNAFVGVCNAVAYAHARGVVHRDLKGQNVILGDFGEVSVLDWGLAKLLDRPDQDTPLPRVALESENDREQTLHGQVLGTPAFMAPEQAAGKQECIGPRTDVYGLGAILYEILTSRPPFSGADTNDILHKVQTEPPTRPSQVCAGLPPALEAICLRALAKEPADRYASAAELAQEVQRWLADEPVAAYREPWTARFGRWSRRHKPAVAGLAALLLTAVVALFLNRVSVGRQRVRAEANFQMALDAVDRFYVQVSENRLLNEPGMQPLRRDLLQQAQQFYQRFVEENQDDPSRQVDLAKVLFQLAGIRDELGDQGSARTDLQRALGIFATLARRHPEVAAYRRGQARCELRLGKVWRTDNRDQTEADWQEALRLLHNLVEEDPTNPADQSDLALCYGNLGLLRERDRPAEADTYYRKALTIQEALCRQQPHHPDYQRDLAGTHSNLGNLCRSRQQWEDALQHHERALALRQALVQESPLALDPQADLAQSQNNLGLLHQHIARLDRQQGRAEQARKHLEQALAHLTESLKLRERLVHGNPSVTRFQTELAGSFGNLSSLYLEMGQRQEAEKKLAKAVGIFQELAEASPKDVGLALNLAKAYLGMGYLFRRESNHAAALSWYDRALGTLQAVAAVNTSNLDLRRTLVEASWSRAEALSALQRYAEALPAWERARDLEDGPNRTTLRMGHAETLARLGRHAAAAAEATALAESAHDSPAVLYQVACIFALSAAAAHNDGNRSAAERDRLTQGYGDQAVDLLTRCQKAGYFQESDNQEMLRKDKDLDALRGRADFQNLLKQALSRL